MNEPVWLSREAIAAFHSALLSRFGGFYRVCDEELLESAFKRPLQLLHYGSPDLFEMAAAYCFAIVKNHPYLDGNKRTGFLAAYTYLGINGFRLNATEEAAALQILALADSRLTEDELADWLRNSASARK